MYKRQPAEQEVLEFYHAYWHDEATWYPAVVMREIYPEFADAHADGPVSYTHLDVYKRQGRGYTNGKTLSSGNSGCPARRRC